MNHRKYSCKGSTDQLFCRSELPSRRSEGSSPSSLHPSSPMRSGFSRRTNVKHVHRACLRTAYISCLHLSNTCSGYQIGQSECINEKLHLACGSHSSRLKVQIAANGMRRKRMCQANFVFGCAFVSVIYAKTMLLSSPSCSKLGFTLGFCRV